MLSVRVSTHMRFVWAKFRRSDYRLEVVAVVLCAYTFSRPRVSLVSCPMPLLSALSSNRKEIVTEPEIWMCYPAIISRGAATGETGGGRVPCRVCCAPPPSWKIFVWGIQLADKDLVKIWDQFHYIRPLVQ
ncbi:hypothetical protein AVEN_97986-1 [Araneus ventricosus]|uniref:Uncharacterized protein n=1 Tax=Araneus ventricosus TaxID=182803 RepID=A0A4Y2IYV3_ARAVE|nr:hypothetical protein AVEN_97986-1 [Araneus ventricosus]